jgi:hypothetical protein
VRLLGVGVHGLAAAASAPAPPELLPEQT